MTGRRAARRLEGCGIRYVDSALDTAADDRLAAWLDRELRTASALTLRTGFYSRAALDVVEQRWEEFLGRGGELLAVLGGDVLQIDLVGLRVLLDLVERFPETLRVHVVVEPVFQNAKTYHVQQPDGRASAWVGSANLTMGGLAHNLEAAITLDTDEDDPDVVDRVREATVAAIDQPAVAVLDHRLIHHLERRVRESGFRFGRASLAPPTELILDHGMALFDQLNQTVSGQPGRHVLATGLSDLDAALGGGLRRGTLTVIASRPGAGRSTLVLNMLAHAAITDGVPACLFTFETTEDEVLVRVMAGHTAIRHRFLRTSTLTDVDWTDLAHGMSGVADAPLYINAGDAPHLEGLCAAIAGAVADHGVDLVVVDPLSFILARSFADTRERELAETARRLKALAMELRIRIVATAELNRQADQLVWLPRLGDIAGSDGIAQAADTVILLHRPDAHDRGERPREADLILVKNRYGERGTVTVAHRLSVSRFITLPSNWYDAEQR